MKLLIITQKVDSEDPVLGFFHKWIEVLYRHTAKTTVICLYKGKSSLPPGVNLFSLGKESVKSRLKYVFNFYKYILKNWHGYDTVFVHMNQEYVLLAGFLWRLAGKKVFMWRNHHSGGLLTDICSLFCNKIFCTSRFSYTTKYKKTIIMPVGVDTDNFKFDQSIVRTEHSLLFLGRIAPIKNVDLFVAAVAKLRDAGYKITASIYGNPLPADQDYYDSIKEQIKTSSLEKIVTLNPGIPHDQTAAVYNRHEIFVNLSTSGMYDKTIFEAMACSCLVLASNENLRGNIGEEFIFKYKDLPDLFSKLKHILDLERAEKENSTKKLLDFARENNLDRLCDRLAYYMCKP